MDRLKKEKVIYLLSKVPEVTIYFWIIKILCTTVGETVSDFLSVNLGIGLLNTTLVMGIIFAIVLFVQFKTKKYIPGIYWLTVVLVSVFGTLVTDNMTDGMGIPLELSTILFSVLLMTTFLLWYRSEKTLSIHSIFTMKREAFYWLTILFTFALGTAVGDLYSEQLGLGYLNTSLAVAAMIIFSFLAWRLLNLNSILTFWIAYVFTRPLGASLGDYLSQPKQYGGLGFGATLTSGIFLLAILIVTAYLAISKVDTIGINAQNITVKTKANKLKIEHQTAIALSVLLLVGVGSYIGLNHEISLAAEISQTTFTDELIPFITIENDMLRAVTVSDFTTAKAKADDLEHLWDKDASKLKKMDKVAWTKIDDSIDLVLSANRSSKPSLDKCNESLQNSLAEIGNY